MGFGLDANGKEMWIEVRVIKLEIEMLGKSLRWIMRINPKWFDPNICM